ncbi:hypothetical protein [Tenacibaculum sp. 190524A05c]|uniref:hypothetical protein n=1 Tax=Tenacibaculum platacis TaxID=3137852 RepID=UPI0031FA8A0C
MRRTIFILNFIFSSLIFAQNGESSNIYEKEYYELLNYVPKNLKNDSIHKLDSPFLKDKLNTIGSLKLYNGFRQDLKLSNKDEKWLDKRIEEIASELFLDGKRILIKSVGGYSGCPNKMIDTFKLKDIEITNLKICNSCTSSNNDKNFIQLFNNKMYSLMKIQPKN